MFCITRVIIISLFYSILTFARGKQFLKSPKSIDILIIIVDDLRPLADVSINLTNIQKLAASGIHFKNAFAQQALCAPSRNSILTGRRPDSLRLYDFYSYWRNDIANFTTIPQYYKQQGYDTYSVGKVFHPGQSSNNTDDYPYSWSEYPYHPPTESYKDSPVCMDKLTRKFQSNLICPVNVNEQPGGSLPDIESLEYAINLFRMRKKAGGRKPMLLAVGFHKPHIPIKYPKEYLRKVPRRTIQPPSTPYMPAAMPLVSYHPWTDVRRRDDIRRLNITFPFGTIPRKWARRIKQSYVAAALYVDDLIGRLLRHVDLDNTAVVVTSDHGWSLGENGLWAKYSNFDAALKVPLIIKVPDTAPRVIHTPVELIDLFPTLVDITSGSSSIPKCKNQNDKTPLCFEGKSLKQLTDESNDVATEFNAISQYPRPSVYPQWNSDKPRLKDIRIMGYSIRTKQFRYTEWVSFNQTSFKRNWSAVYGVELYRHDCDSNESNNLYLNNSYDSVRKYLSKLLRSTVEPITQ